MVDPGDPDEAFLDAIEAEVAAGGGRVVAIALTHVDPGHAAGSEELRARTSASILVGPGGAAPLSWDVTEIGGEDSVGEGDGAVVAVPTPGHRPDHLAFLTPDGTLIAGDALTDRPAVIFPPEGDRTMGDAGHDRRAGRGRDRPPDRARSRPGDPGRSGRGHRAAEAALAASSPAVAAIAPNPFADAAADPAASCSIRSLD